MLIGRWVSIFIRDVGNVGHVRGVLSCVEYLLFPLHK